MSTLPNINQAGYEKHEMHKFKVMSRPKM